MIWLWPVVVRRVGRRRSSRRKRLLPLYRHGRRTGSPRCWAPRIATTSPALVSGRVAPIDTGPRGRWNNVARTGVHVRQSGAASRPTEAPHGWRIRHKPAPISTSTNRIWWRCRSPHTAGIPAAAALRGSLGRTGTPRRPRAGWLVHPALLAAVPDVFDDADDFVTWNE